jgi:hypothetical protein
VSEQIKVIIRREGPEKTQNQQNNSLNIKVAWSALNHMIKLKLAYVTSSECSKDFIFYN